MQKKLVLALLMAAALFLMIGLSGCESEGPAEKAGEKIDESVESTKDAVEEAGDKIEEAGEEAKEAVDPDKE